MLLHALTLVTILSSQPAPSAPELTDPALPASLDLEAIRALPVQHDGRWPPLDTAARDIVETVTGTSFFQGHDPVVVLLAWTFAPQEWSRARLISIPEAELREELELSESRTAFCYAELAGHRRLDQVLHTPTPPGQKPDALLLKARDIREKLDALERAFGPGAIRPIPSPDDPLGPARAVGAASPHGGEATSAAAGEAWKALREAFAEDDAEAFSAAAEQLAEELEKLPAAYRPDADRIALELSYNKLRPFRIAWIVMLLGAALAAAAMLVRRGWFDVVVVVGIFAGFVVLTYGLSMRWRIAGRIPAANMFESLLFLSWGMGAFAVGSAFVFRHRLVPLTAAATGAVALILADNLYLDQFIRPLKPVLQDTIWMSIHVPVIMVSYSVLALAVVIAHVQLVIMTVTPRHRELIKSVDTLHYWYVHVGSILLVAGIITGSMWAASSWGRYWGWDPKEVWSLVACLGYLAILHARLDRARTPGWLQAVGAILCLALFVAVVPKLDPKTWSYGLALAGTLGAMVFFVLARGRAAVAFMSVLAFWLIVMTYVGVNYVLGTGLHSYGFGAGAVANYFLWIGSIDLGLVLALAGTAVYFEQTASPSTPPGEKNVATA